MALTALFSSFVLWTYVPKTLQGNFDQHVLPSKMFGMPEQLRQHGFSELYGVNESGWDGQFYYYMANDIFANKDTAAHLDAPAYRYQRIGLPLLAHLLSRVTFQSWVSPAVYYLTSLLLVLSAAGMAARHFSQRGMSPLVSLVWALGFGTQITMLNGLPDAAADALLILAILALLERRMWMYSMTITFAALSREIYVLVPATMVAMHLLSGLTVRQQGGQRISLPVVLWRCLPHVPAPLLAAGWQIYLKHHFGVSPSSQAAGILGAPFASTWQYLMLSITGKHPLLPRPADAYVQAALLMGYIALCLASAFALAKTVMIGCRARQLRSVPGTELLAFNLAMLATIALYSAFGPTVMMHHTGYLKAANVFLFVLPFAIGQFAPELTRHTLWKALCAATVAVMLLMIWSRIAVSGSYPRVLQPANIELAESEPACIAHPQARLNLVSTHGARIWPQNFWTSLRTDAPFRFDIEVHNLSDVAFAPYGGKGAVNLSYQWLDKNDRVVRDGVRTPLAAPLQPGDSVIRPIVVDPPFLASLYHLRVSLVQEGCSWFYRANPSTGLDVPYQ